jgi:hypothetical protein
MICECRFGSSRTKDTTMRGGTQRSDSSTWCLPKGSISLRLDRKAAIFLISGETLIHFSSTFVLMGAPRFIASGVQVFSVQIFILGHPMKTYQGLSLASDTGEHVVVTD